MSILPSNPITKIIDPIGVMRKGSKFSETFYPGGNKGGQPGQPGAPAAPQVDDSSELEKEKARRIGRAALVSQSPRGVLGNANTSRSMLTAG